MRFDLGDSSDPKDESELNPQCVVAHKNRDCLHSVNYYRSPTGKPFPGASSNSPKAMHPFCSGRWRSKSLLDRPLSYLDFGWDLNKNPAFVEIRNSGLIRDLNFDEPLLGLSIIAAQIHFKDPRLWRLEHRWGSIVVHTLGPNQPLTLMHIMKAIFTYFQNPVTNGDVSALSKTDLDRNALDTTWFQRNLDNHPREMYKAWRYMPDPVVRRVDFLHGFTWFRELQLVTVDSQTCRLFLSIQ